MSKKTILIWFRNDLRIHDNEILSEAIKKSSTVIPVYCFDPRYFTKSAFGPMKTGVLRAKFLLESVADLKHSLSALGGDLLVLEGKPEELLPDVAKKYNVQEVYHHREVAYEETEISSAVEAALWKQQINLKHFIGHTLYHKEELPFPIKDIPDVFATFRKKIGRDSKIRPGFETPSSITVPAALESSIVPALSDLGWAGLSPVPAGYFEGGETFGLSRLHDYLWNQPAPGAKKAGNGHAEHIYSRLSPWIAAGCLSVRKVYWEIKDYERENGPSEATNILTYELLWRDYFRFMFKKYGSKFFTGPGTAAGEPGDDKNFELWKTGQTGEPAIDTFMQELNSTGYITNKGRQDTATYLVNELKVNWVLGGAYFEEKLIDYSPASNWGNWAHIAGIINTLRK